MKRLEPIFRDEKRYKDFRTGFQRAMRDAAEFIDSWKASGNGFRLGDLLLHKFNQTNRKPRRLKK